MQRHAPIAKPIAACLAALAASLLAACDSAPVLAPAPYVMLGDAGRAWYRSIPNHLKTPEIPVIYWTDRQREELKGGGFEYAARRSDNTFHGIATIAPEDEDLTWGDFVTRSTTKGSNADVRLRVDRLQQNGNFYDVLGELEVDNGQLVYPDAAVERYLQNVEKFNASMEPYLKPGNDNAAIIFIHGFNNDFDGAALRLAKTWHAIGREAVPIVFSWPAGRDGLKPIAYNHDRESGEFAVQSLKKLLFSLALNDRIARVHLVAHSRGTDILSTAIREVEMEIAGALRNTPFAQLTIGKDADELGETAFEREPSDITKIETLTLVAADLDLDVFLQRFVVNRSGRAAKRILIYTSAKDKAIWVSGVFFGSDKRLGRATIEDFSAHLRSLVAALPKVEFIECRVKTDDSHLYLFEHPAALSDMVLAIRDGKRAGAEHGRPLKPADPNHPGFWVLDEDYLRPDETN